MPYIYQGDIWCDKCGEEIRAELTAQGEAPEDPDDEHTFDSDDFPKKYRAEDEEADGPQNCASGDCDSDMSGLVKYGTFLNNGLTSEGYTFLKEMLDARGKHLLPYQQEWAEYYHFTYHENEWASPHEWLNEKLSDCEGYAHMTHYETEGKSTELLSYAKTMAAALDPDQIQDLFQSDMEEDGYFKKSGWYSPEME